MKKYKMHTKYYNKNSYYKFYKNDKREFIFYNLFNFWNLLDLIDLESRCSDSITIYNHTNAVNNLFNNLLWTFIIFQHVLRKQLLQTICEK